MTLREPLDKVEARILGVLVEKELTTPDAYPLSLNGLLNGCNQKSNRDPVLSLDEQAVNEALLRLRLHRLVREVHEAGARVVKFAHEGRAVLEVDTPALAVLAELLMRGPQMAGELRARVDRMSPLAGQAELAAILRPLVARGMVAILPPSPGSRAERYAQTLAPGIHPGVDVPRAGARASGTSAPAAHPAHAERPAPPVEARPAAPSDLASRVEALERTVARLQRELDALRARGE